MADEYEREDVDNEFHGRERGGSESDVDEYDHLNGTTAAQARSGKDIQGIPWDMLSITREKYRQTRLEQYRNHENIPHSGEGSPKKGSSHYEFRRNSRSVKPTVVHFQLRNLVWATSKHDVYLINSVNNSRATPGTKVAIEKLPGSLLEGFTQTQVSSLSVKEKLLHLDQPGFSFCSRTTSNDNAITNAVEIYVSFSGAFHFTASNNDCGVRDFDMEKFQLSKHFRFSWPVNVSPLDCIFWLFISRNGHLVILGCICIDSMGSKFYKLQIISHDIRADDDSFNYISNDTKILHLPTTWNHGGAT
ncbi:hypothetical protein CFP56_029548 [Quercus suber]|uniref:Transducin/WD40 repeat-like superfamily protein n=1 Tax=Quercus suber TaxID=58331 RepID=A0AAW0JQL4_QUESU